MRYGHRWRTVAATAVAVAGVAATAPIAQGATTCDYSSSGKFLQVLLSAANDVATLEVSGGQIVVGDGSNPVTCTGTGGPPTTTNTNVIQAFNTSGHAGNRVSIHGAGNFAPGADVETAENGGTPEIEIFVNLNDGNGATLDVYTAAAGGHTRFGKDGINPNATATESQPDVDINPTGVPESNLNNFGSNGPDVLGAQGGLGTGAALTVGNRLEGGGGVDEVVGSEGVDLLEGEWGDDTLSAMGGSDNIRPDGDAPLTTDDDTIDGGPGTDTVSYSGDTTEGVTVDLGVATRQNTAGGANDLLSSVENLIGTNLYADVLRGGPGTNVLFGLGGADNLDVRDGGPDSADCGGGADTVTADAPGVDTLIACETVLYPQDPATPTITPVPAPGGPGPGVPLLARAAIRSLRLAPSQFAAFERGPSARAARRGARTRGSIVSFTANVASTVTYRVARARPGRRVGRRCLAPTRANRRNRPCIRFVLLRGSFARAATAGSNRFRFTGRLRGRKLGPGTYQLRGTPRADGRNGVTRRAGFRIVR